jgi:hypothetical protein
MAQFRNFMHTLPLLNGTGRLDHLHKQFSRVPAIIIGAGPSLERNIHLLKDARQKALLIAVDSIHDRLLAEGIVPHVVVTIDQQEICVNKIRRDPHPGTALFYAPGAHPGLVERFERRFMGFYGPSDFQVVTAAWLGLPHTAEMSTTAVSQFAFESAYKLGCSPLILVGQDLAVTASASHAEGVLYRTPVDEIAGRYCQRAPGNFGGNVLTDDIFLIQAMAYHEFRKKNDCRCCNSTAGGMSIPGFGVHPLYRIVDDFDDLKKDPSGQLYQLHNRRTPIKYPLTSDDNLFSCVASPLMLERQYQLELNSAVDLGAIDSLREEDAAIGEFVKRCTVESNEYAKRLAGDPSAMATDIWDEWLRSRRGEISPLGAVWLKALTGG